MTNYHITYIRAAEHDYKKYYVMLILNNLLFNFIAFFESLSRIKSDVYYLEYREPIRMLILGMGTNLNAAYKKHVVIYIIYLFKMMIPVNTGVDYYIK